LSCQRCGSPLAEDQEWCLECGAANTVIRKAPDWRIALAVVSVVIALSVFGFVIALARA
jgi:RNA polymerase subunit RPABC4/transcription elongation factor Spt4